MWDGEILQTSPKEALFPHSLTQIGTSLQSSPSPSQTNNEWMLAILGQKAYRTFQWISVKNLPEVRCCLSSIDLCSSSDEEELWDEEEGSTSDTPESAGLGGREPVNEK